MISTLNIIIASGFLAIVYGYLVGKQILSASPGNRKMQEIASAIQEGARAYLNRQYKTISIVGFIILIVITYALGFWVGIGYFIGAFLSGAAGYIGMLVSVQANVRTAEASRKGLAAGLNIGFKSGAVTGMLVAGLALLSIAVYYTILLKLNIDNREIINALVDANKGTISSYGSDQLTKKACDLLSKTFNKDLSSFFVSTGTAANSLALSNITPPFGSIFCGEDSHIYLEECNAPEFFSNSAKLFPIPTAEGKIIAEDLNRYVSSHPSDKFDMVASSLSISQATECGTIYTEKEIDHIFKIAKQKNLNIHMDGARFANVVAATNKNPSDLTWGLGVDVLSFGTTKNGTLSAEAVLFFNKELCENMNQYLKRSGHLLSKMRYLSAQIIGYLENDLWLELARKANGQANKLCKELKKFDCIKIPWEREINEVFLLIPNELERYLEKNNIKFHEWTKVSLSKKYADDKSKFIRLVTSYNTTDDEIYNLSELIARY